MTRSLVEIQIAPEAVPSVPCCFGEAAIVARLCGASGLLQAIEQRVRFALRRFGTYEVLDLLVVLIDYTVCSRRLICFLLIYKQASKQRSSKLTESQNMCRRKEKQMQIVPNLGTICI